MAEYDLVIRNTTIATASDVVKGDIGIAGGRVVALGERLDKGHREIDGTGRIAVPGGIDAHVHFDQDTADGSVFCDDFESGSRAAAAGGTTTIVDFAIPVPGEGTGPSDPEPRRARTEAAVRDASLNFVLAANQIATPAVKAGGIGTLDRARLERQIDTIVEAFSLPARPAIDAIYDGQYLPSAAERKL